ncbi:MAG: hypothetical protein ACRDZ4_22420 [Egibacteraceae bacterium]
MPTEASSGGHTVPGLGEDAGPHPVMRAVTSLLLGLGVGLVSALLVRRREDQGVPASPAWPPDWPQNP